MRQPRRDAMTATPEEIRAAIAKAYEEGFYDGESHGAQQWKHEPFRVAWLLSKTRESCFPEPTATQQREIAAWKEAKYAARMEWNGDDGGEL